MQMHTHMPPFPPSDHRFNAYGQEYHRTLAQQHAYTYTTYRCQDYCQSYAPRYVSGDNPRLPSNPLPPIFGIPHPRGYPQAPSPFTYPTLRHPPPLQVGQIHASHAPPSYTYQPVFPGHLQPRYCPPTQYVLAFSRQGQSLVVPGGQQRCNCPICSNQYHAALLNHPIAWPNYSAMHYAQPEPRTQVSHDRWLMARPPPPTTDAAHRQDAPVAAPALRPTMEAAPPEQHVTHSQAAQPLLVRPQLQPTHEDPHPVLTPPPPCNTPDSQRTIMPSGPRSSSDEERTVTPPSSPDREYESVYTKQASQLYSKRTKASGPTWGLRSTKRDIAAVIAGAAVFGGAPSGKPLSDSGNVDTADAYWCVLLEAMVLAERVSAKQAEGDVHEEARKLDLSERDDSEDQNNNASREKPERVLYVTDPEHAAFDFVRRAQDALRYRTQAAEWVRQVQDRMRAREYHLSERRHSLNQEPPVVLHLRQVRT